MWASFFVASSHTVPVMYGVALVLPQPLLQDNVKAERKKETETQTQVSFVRLISENIYWDTS